MRVILHINPPHVNQNDANQIVGNRLATCVSSLQFLVNRSMQTSPGALELQYNIIMNVPLRANLYIVQQRGQQLIDANVQRTNVRHVQHN